ncbi:probable carboxylesterase 8 [Olea europaea var. sylvestris]|uniref:probable carboxylesterase 8 n=1 Tax=Olea europaea var. sylvestris TaxID=158386 RepID=UPI000C1D3D90|nr:probable carboxylesterase 8 [Olea europaea var. sylvestris]
MAMAIYKFLLLFLLFCQFGQKIISSDEQKTPTHTLQEAYDALGIKPNPDGSLTREIRIPMVNATPNIEPTSTTQIALSKDIPLNPFTKTFIRLYKPLNPTKNSKIPLIIYLHGGDFVLFSAKTVIFHEFCNQISAQFPAVVASVEYRLAPEHRLPAAFDDAMDAIIWARNQAACVNGGDGWMKQLVDFSHVFLLGSSAGGNIVYHAALRAFDLNLSPIKIRGLIMNQAYFGGVHRTESEIRLSEDAYVPLYVNDLLWSYALPKNANRDHVFCNPLMIGDLGKIRRLPRVLIKGDEGDPLVDREKLLAKFLKGNGVQVVSIFNGGGNHGIELSNTTAAQALYDAMKDFILSTIN